MSLRALVFASILVALPSTVFASGIDGVGRLEVVAGWRLTPNGYFENSAKNAGTPVVGDSSGGPIALLGFGYGATSSIEVNIELLAGEETLTLAPNDRLRSVTYGALVGGRFFALLAGGKIRPFAGLALGPLLVNESSDSAPVKEKVTDAFAVSLGATYQVSDHWGLSLEYRLILARGVVPGIGGINGGGSWFGIGLNYDLAPRPDLDGTFH